MLLQVKPIAVKTLSCRTDEELYEAVSRLAATTNTQRSTLMRIGLAMVLAHATKVRAKSVDDLTVDAT